MNTHLVIMVQIADRSWTLDALHSAGLLARRHSNQPGLATIALVRMVPVQHTGWLGTEWGNLDFTPAEGHRFEDYRATIEDYGVECTLVLFQYVTWDEATLQVAESLHADLVFARTPDSIIPFWTRFIRWSLRRQLRRQGCEWIENPVDDARIETYLPDPEIAHSAATF